jgi:cholesterol transport system auxiliary component
MTPLGKRLLCASCALLSLSACGSLLGGGDKAVLYRLGGDIPPAQAAPAGELPVRVARPILPSGAEGERILAISGREAAHLAGSRWVGPAPDLLRETIAAAVARAGGPAYALNGGGSPKFLLSTGFTHFAAYYDGGPEQPPVVRIAAQTELRRAGNDQPIAVALHSAEQRASDNRVSAITEAFDAASLQISGDIAAWLQRHVDQAR